MKVVALQDANLDACLQDAREQGVVITRRGKPLALLLSVEGLDLEQIELGHSDIFWEAVQRWRQQPTISRAELDRQLYDDR